MPSSQARSRRSLFQKYLLALFVAVAVPLLASELSDAWFGYRDQSALLNSLLQAEAGSAARKIQSFLEEIRDQLG